MVKRKYLLIAAYFITLLDEGGFKAHTVYLVSFVGLLLIFGAIQNKGYLLIENKTCLFCKFLMIAGGILSVFTGIDRGESLFGFLRLASILIMGLAAQQLEDKDKDFFLRAIPIAGVLSLAGCFIHHFSLFEEWVSAVGRVNGPFGYANTMALFLLLGIAILEHSDRRGRRVMQLILALGLLATGSRTAFVILCGYLIWNLIRYRGRNKSIVFAFLGMIALIGVISIAGGNLHAMDRFLKLDINASTLQGRFLYWGDAVRMLAQRPVGLGYMGYFYYQQAEQTGVYSVRFVHNDWLQWALDYGMLAGVGLAAYLCCQCKSDKMPLVNKELLCLIAIHSFFDFNLQFFTIVFIALILIPSGGMVWKFDAGVKKKSGWKYGLLAGMCSSVCLCISSVAADYYAGMKDYGQAVKWNRLSAQYKQEYLLQSEDLDTAASYAERLLQGNRYLYAAYLIKSNAAAQEGRLEDFIVNRRRALQLRKYELSEYEDYFEILFDWYGNAYEKNEVQEMGLCRAAMEDIPRTLDEIRRGTSLRAYRIKDKPDLTLDSAYIDLLEKIRQGKWN